MPKSSRFNPSTQSYKRLTLSSLSAPKPNSDVCILWTRVSCTWAAASPIFQKTASASQSPEAETLLRAQLRPKFNCARCCLL